MPQCSILSVARLAALACPAVLLASSPATAEERAPQDVTAELADPANQVAVAVALTAISQALLDIRIEPIRRAMEAVGDDAAADLPPDARLRDLAGPGAERLPGEIGRRVPQAMGAAAGMAGAVRDMLPELQATVARMRDAIPRP